MSIVVIDVPIIPNNSHGRISMGQECLVMANFASISVENESPLDYRRMRIYYSKSTIGTTWICSRHLKMCVKNVYQMLF